MNLKKKIIISVLSLVFCLAVAASIIMVVLKGESSYLQGIRETEIRKNINIDATLKTTGEAVERGDELSYYYDLMGKLNPDKMSPEQLLRYTMLEGDLYLDRFRKSKIQKSRQVFFDRAVKQYSISAQLTSSPEMRAGLLRRIARMNIENQNWNEALENFDKAYPLITVPKEKWLTDLEMADCLIRLNRIAPAMDRINLAVNSDDQEVSSRAMLEKAGILIRALDSPKLAEEMSKYFLEIDPKYQAYVTEKKTPKYLKEKAEEIYKAIIAKLPNVNPLHSRAELGLLHLAVIDGKADYAFNLANRMLSGPADRESMVKAMLELATLEENRQNIQEAIKIVKRALQKYPLEAAKQQSGLILYNLYKKIKNWDAAFSIARNLFQSTSDPAAICKLVKDFTDGNDMIFDIIINSSDKESYIIQLQQIFSEMEKDYPKEWAQIKVSAYYILAHIYFASDNFQKAQEMINLCFLNQEKGKPIDEKILRLDFICATKTAQSPALIISRARRYLNSYPKGPYYRNALLELLRGYFQMGLYEPALSISRKIYADELDSASKNIEKDQLWMETVAIIAQCYFKMGQGEVANRLLKNFSQDILKKKYNGDIYYVWAQISIEQNQIPEAIRRLNVALMYTTDPGEQLKLKLAQCLLFLKAGSLKDFYEAGMLFKQLEKDKLLSPQIRADFQRKLLEELLKYSLENKMTPEFDAIFKKSLKDNSTEPWVQYWMLRSLTPYFSQENLQALSLKHEEILKRDAVILKDKASTDFIRTQLNLIKDLIDVEAKYEKLKKSEGVNL